MLAALTGGSDPWANPEWFLLSYCKPITASSSDENKGPEKAVDENIRTWWRAAGNSSGEWLEIDLGNDCSIHAVQINFADDVISTPIPYDKFKQGQSRYIEEVEQVTRWILEGSLNNKDYFLIEDKSNVKTDLPHDLIIRENGLQARYIKLTVIEVPYKQKSCVSGLRVFGIGNGQLPNVPKYRVHKLGETDMDITIERGDAVGYNILWGHLPEKLYHSYMIFNTQQRIGALVKGETYFVRVDSFNENGITEGILKKLEEV